MKNEITKEYPEGQRAAEMVLVQMLREHRSWDDRRAIADALWSLRFHAKSMQKERDQMDSQQGCERNNSSPPNSVFSGASSDASAGKQG